MKNIMLILVGMIDKLVRNVFLVKGGGGILRDNDLCYVVFLSGSVIVYLCACNTHIVGIFLSQIWFNLRRDTRDKGVLMLMMMVPMVMTMMTAAVVVGTRGEW